MCCVLAMGGRFRLLIGMRRAVHERQPCHEKILNYQKNGTPYWFKIAITPITDEAGQPRWLVARERELPELFAA